MSVTESEVGVPVYSPIAAFENDLSLRTNRFIDHWLKKGNGTEAARIAGFPGGDNALASAASRLLRNPKVAAEIKRRLGKHIASADEVLERLTAYARSDLTDVLDSAGNFDLKAAKQKRILKKLKGKTRYETGPDGNSIPVTEFEYEIHDPLAALEKMGKFHKLFTDKTESEVNLSDQDVNRIGESLMSSLMEAAERRRQNVDNAEVKVLNP